jgi:polysaccharide biosynthesis protein PslH
MVKRVLIVCNDPPYPTIHGGRMDMWNRIKGFAKLGLQIQLIYWYDSSRPKENDKGHMYEFVDSIIEVHRKMSITNLLHYKYPPRMMSCNVIGSQFDDILLKVTEFKPDCVWLDLWYGYFTARRISLLLQIPLIYRSQNVEFQYFQQLYKDARGLLKFKLFLNLKRMKKAELEVRTESNIVYDISQSDNDTWESEAPSLKAEVLLPTCIPSKEVIDNDNSSSAPDIDILFVGNLNNPSNVSGLKWFVTKVLGNIRAHVGKITTVFAGSNPSEEIRLLCGQCSVECVPNPENVYKYYNRAKVIINPQLEGSGISLKMVELLLTSKPVVTTSVGVRGLPNEAIANFNIGNTPGEFSEGIISCLSGGTNVDCHLRKAHLERYFGLKPLATVLDTIDSFKTIKKQINGDSE